MRPRIVFKKRLSFFLVFGLSTACAFGADASHQAPNFADDGKDRHVGKILLPVMPAKPPQTTATTVIKTSSTKPATPQSKAQTLLDSLKSTDAKSEVKGAKPADKASDKPKGQPTEATSKEKGKSETPKASSSSGSSPADKNAADKNAAASGKAGAGKEKDSGSDKSVKSSSSTHPKTKAFRNDGFIPPPPPVQPSILMTGEMNGPGVMPFTVEYMNKDELLEKQKELQSQLTDAREQLKETEEAGAEKKTRAERFDPLYKEGVVSRHELEAAQKEALDVDKEVERAKNHVSQIENQSASVDKKLKEIEKRTLPVSPSSRKKSRK